MSFTVAIGAVLCLSSAGCEATGIADLALVVRGGVVCSYSDLFEDVEAVCAVDSPVNVAEFSLRNTGVSTLHLDDHWFPGDEQDRFESIELDVPATLAPGQDAPALMECRRSTCTTHIAVEFRHDLPGTRDIFEFVVHAQDRL